MSEVGPNLENLHRQTFEDLTKCLADANDFPELVGAQLAFVQRELAPKDDCFPMKQIDAGSIKFEFDTNRFDNFRQQFHNELDNRPVARLGLDRLASILFIGTGLTRPIIQYEFFRKHGLGNPAHRRAVGEFFKNNSDLVDTFHDVFETDLDGDWNFALAEQIPDSRIMEINGLRVGFSFLYGSLRRDSDKRMFGELVTDCRDVLRETVVRERPTFKAIGEPVVGLDVGDSLLMDTIPNWEVALTTPIRESSYRHLGKKFWHDRFELDPEELMTRVPRELGGLMIDRPPSIMPSHYSGDVQ